MKIFSIKIAIYCRKSFQLVLFLLIYIFSPFKTLHYRLLSTIFQLICNTTTTIITRSKNTTG